MKKLSILLIALLIVICPILGRADTTLISQQVINIGCVYAPPTSGNTTYTQVLQSNTSVNVTCNNNIGNINLNPNQSASIQCLGNVAGNVSPTTLTLGSTTVISCNPAGGGGSTPTGPAGGDLGGTYPNPTVTSGAHVGSGTLPNAALVTPPITACSGDINAGCSQVTSGAHLSAGSVPNASLVTTPLTSITGGGAVTNNFVSAISSGGAATLSQPTCGNLSNSVASCSTDATNASNISSGTLSNSRLASQPYDIGVNFAGTPTASQIVTFACVRTINWPANFTTPTSQAVCGTNPGETDTYTIAVAGSTIGTVALSTSCVATFATQGGATESCTAGQSLTITAPGTVSGKDIGITLSGTR